MKTLATLAAFIVASCTSADGHVRVGCGEGYSLAGSASGFSITVGEGAQGACTIALPTQPTGKRLVCTIATPTAQMNGPTLSWMESDETITIIGVVDGRTYDATCKWVST